MTVGKICLPSEKLALKDYSKVLYKYQIVRKMFFFSKIKSFCEYLYGSQPIQVNTKTCPTLGPLDRSIDA